jgi:hypothetical protein
MSGYFKSLVAELMPGWTFWRSSRQPTKPLDGAPLDAEVGKAMAREATASDAPTRNAAGEVITPAPDAAPGASEPLDRTK